MSDLPEPQPATPPAATRRNFYGRRFGHTLRASQKGYLAEDLGALRPVGVSPADNPTRAAIDTGAFFGNARPIWLEIGFGGGEHMVAMAARYPDVGIIGCEPYINGVAMLLGKIRAAAVGNLSVYPGDARDLLDVLPEGALAKAFLNYPDPWPKKRHHRRRFVTQDHLGLLARAMAPSAEFRVATDIADYMRQALVEVPRAGFGLVSVGAVAWDDWVLTRYEAKALREGRAPQYATFRRL